MHSPGEHRPDRTWRRIVVIGASAGGIESLSRVLRPLPREFPAPILVTIHVPTTAISLLPHVLVRATGMPASHPREGDPLLPGHVHVAPPDRHLLVDAARLRLGTGARENWHRPAIDPMFRSAARWYGPRVVAVVLSGMLGDGGAGLRRVREAGGTTIVQDPHDAPYSDMPRRAIGIAQPDHVLCSDAIPDLLVRLVGTPAPAGGRVDAADLPGEVGDGEAEALGARAVGS